MQLHDIFGHIYVPIYNAMDFLFAMQGILLGYYNLHIYNLSTKVAIYVGYCM